MTPNNNAKSYPHTYPHIIHIDTAKIKQSRYKNIQKYLLRFYIHIYTSYTHIRKMMSKSKNTATYIKLPSASEKFKIESKII